jgi:uncharacterized SAM-binding protein YcdF (DUF218 family)
MSWHHVGRFQDTLRAMATLKGLIGMLVMPVPVTLLLVLLGLAAAVAGWRRAGFTLLAAAPLLLALAAWAPVADRLLAPLEQAHPPLLDATAHTRVAAVVVLGSAFRPDASLPVTAQLGDTALVRLSEGIRLYRQLEGVPLLLSGGSREGGRPPASGYAEAARALGVPESDIIELDGPVENFVFVGHTINPL